MKDIREGILFAVYGLSAEGMPENQKQEVRTMRRMNALLFVEGLAGGCIMLPVILAGKSAGSGILCLVLGVIFWCFVMKLVMKWAETGKDDRAMVLRFAGFWYFLAQAAVFINWWAELVHGYLLPVLPVSVLCLIPFLAGICLSRKKLRERAGFCRVIAPGLVTLMLLMIVVAGMSAAPFEYSAADPRMSDRIPGGIYEVFACMGGMFLPLLSGHINSNRKAKAKRAVLWAGCTQMAVAGGFYLAIMTFWGSTETGGNGFVLLDMMYHVRTAGELGQCGGGLLSLILLVSITMGVAGAFWNLREICTKLCPEVLRFAEDIYRERRKGIAARECTGSIAGRSEEITSVIWVTSVLLAYSAAAGFLDAQAAVCYYRAYNMQIIVSLMLLFYLVSAVRRKIKTADAHLLLKKDCRL